LVEEENVILPHPSVTQATCCTGTGSCHKDCLLHKKCLMPLPEAADSDGLTYGRYAVVEALSHQMKDQWDREADNRTWKVNRR